LKILITGGSGFIGKHTAEMALKNGYEVRIFDKVEPISISKEIEFFPGSILSKESCAAALIGVDKVIHLAAYSRSGPSTSKWSECLDTNINGTINILEASQMAGVSRFVYAGSSTFYGNQVGVQRIGDQGDFLNFYGLSKYFGEELTNQFQLHFGLNAINLRYFNVYGPGQPLEGAYGLVMGIFSQAKKLGEDVEIHGTGEQRRDFIHVQDVARANLAALNKTSVAGTYNIGTGKNVSINELAEMFNLKKRYVERRNGDAEITLADISETISNLGWNPTIDLLSGIRSLDD
jgi:nucleoside-diphosphate-sugar epimerase